jgi:YggT family protein
MMEFFRNVAIFFVSILFDLYIFVVMLRLLLQWCRANYYNPVAQFTVALTNPIVKPLRRILPAFHNIDLSLILLLVVLEFVKLLIILLLLKQLPNIGLALVWTCLLLINKLLNFYFFAIIVRVILSWFLHHFQTNPITKILFVLTEPILYPARRLLPPISGLDLSPLLVIIGLKVISMFIVFLLATLGAPVLLT